MLYPGERCRRWPRPLPPRWATGDYPGSAHALARPIGSPEMRRLRLRAWAGAPVRSCHRPHRRGGRTDSRRGRRDRRKQVPEAGGWDAATNHPNPPPPRAA
jgi:hypothetical protein